MEPKELAKLTIDSEIEEQKKVILEKIKDFMGKDFKDPIRYNKRLAKIMTMIKEKLLSDGETSNLLKNADIYQKIELFMTYDVEEETGHIKNDIYEIIGEVFKAFYILFILSHLEEEPEFMIPYLGNMRIKEVERFIPLFDKIVHYFYGSVNLDKTLRSELHKMKREEKTETLKHILKKTEESLSEHIV
jgi:hypothetical protein